MKGFISHIVICLVAMLVTGSVFAQDIARAEFFFNTDPGVGNGITIEFPDGNPITATPTIPTTGLEAGWHRLFIRVQDTDGNWSIAKEQAVHIIDIDPPSPQSASKPIAEAEYFFNTDPGPGNGTPIQNFILADNFNLELSFPTTGLPEGDHYLYIRTRDQQGKWSISKRDTITIVAPDACIVPQVTFEADTVDFGSTTTFTNLSTSTDGATTWEWDVGLDGSIEGTGSSFTYNFPASGYYFVKLTADNGGNCQASYVGLILVGPLPDTDVIADGPLEFCEGGSVTLTAAPGLSYLWSNGESTQSILVSNSGDYSVQVTSPSGIIQFSETYTVTVNELPSYFPIVDDETNGNGNGQIAIVPNDELDTYTYLWNTLETTNVISGLSAGAYSVEISNGNCSSIENFSIVNTVETEGLYLAEYFIDTDPGPGMGTPIPLSEGVFIDSYVNIPTTGLSEGVHRLYMRMRDLDGSWGIARKMLFSVQDQTPPIIPESSELISAEYFIDSDPGVGNGIPVDVPDGDSYSELLNVPVAGLEVGDHHLFIRSLSADGEWGISKPFKFFVHSVNSPVLPEPNPEIVYAEYFFDSDPGAGNGIELENLVPGDNVDLVDFLPVAGLPVGSHHAFIRVKDENAKWSLYKAVQFDVVPVACTVPQPDFSSDQVMAGTPTSFSNLTTGYEAGVSWEWDIGNDGTVEGTGFNFNYTFATPGIYYVRLTATNAPECYASIVHPVVVLPAPDTEITASGPLQFCDGSSVTLIAEPGNTYLWNTGETTQTINVTTSGDYWCEVTNTFGFELLSEILTVEVFDLPLYSIYSTDANQGMSNGTGNVIPDNNINAYTYLWSDGQTTSSAVNLLPGIYTIDITNGGCVVSDGVVVNDNPLSEGILYGEYFIDTDPGVGLGNPIYFTQGNQINHIDYIDLTPYSEGVHNLFVRIREDNDSWSIAKAFEFDIVDDSGPQLLPPSPQIVHGEYFFDEDPGAGNGTAFSLTAGDAVSGNIMAPATGLEPGNHYAYVRLQDADGKWGLTKKQIVHVYDPIPELPSAGELLVAAEYFFDTDPGAGNGTPIDFLNYDSPVDIEQSINVGGLSVGPHTVWVRVKDANGKWSITKERAFDVIDTDCIAPQVDFTYSTVDAGVSMTLSNTSTDVDGLTAYQWDIFNDGISDAASQDFAYTFPTPGIYQISLTAINYVGTVDQCEASTVQNVIVGPVPDITISADGPTEFCSGGSVNLSVDPGNSYLWSTGETTNTITVTESGNYWVQVTDAYMTLASESFEVTVYDDILVGGVINDENNGNSNGSVISEVTGGTGNYDYSWSDGQTTANAVGLSAGLYTLTVTDEYCDGSANFMVNNIIGDQYLIACEYFYDTDPGVGNGTPLEISQGDEFTQPAYLDVTGLSAGDHFLFIRTINEFGEWSIAKQKKFNVYDQTPPVPQPPASDIADAEYFVDTDTGVGTAIPVTTLTPGPSVTENDVVDVSALAIGDYYLYTRVLNTDNEWSISKRIPFTITEECQDYTLNIANLSCFNSNDGQVEILINPGSEPYDISWSNGDTGPISSSLPVGDITVTAVDVNGCIIQETVTITQPDEIFITVDASTSSCTTPNGTATSVVVGGVPPYDYLWSSGETTAGATMLGIGENFLTITDVTGCQETYYFDVLPNDGPTVTGLIGDVTCYGGSNGSVTLSIVGGVTPYDILWDDGQTTIVATGLSEGIHDVTVTDGAGCEQAFSYYVAQPLPIQINFISQDVTYYQGSNGSASVLISGGTPVYDILWETGETTTMVNGLSIDSYDVTVTDALGCVEVGTVDILDAVICLSDSINYEVDICTGETVGLFTDTGIYYEWSTGSNDATIYVSPPDTTMYDLYRLDVNGCPYYDTVTVNVIDESVNAGIISGPINVVLNQINNYDVTGSVGTIQWQYSYDLIDWFNFPGAINTTEALSFDQVGTAWIRIQVESGNCGISYGAPYEITVDDILGNRFDIPIVIPTLPYNDTRETGDYTDNYTGSGNQESSDVFYQYTVEQCTDSIVVSLCGSSFDTYLHILDSNGDLINSNNNALECGNFNSLLTLTGVPEGETIYFVVEGNGAATGILYLDVFNVDPYIVNSGEEICSGETVVLETALGESFLWSTTETTSSIEVSPETTTTYFVDITNANGCVYNDEATVFVTATEQITAEADTAICFGGSASLLVSGSTFYSWSSGQTTDAINVSPFVTTTYYVTGTDLNGCSDVDSVLVTVQYSAPAATVLTSPADATTDATLPVTFDWEDTPDALDYNFYIWLDTEAMPGTPYDTPVLSEETISTGLADETYLWSVEAVNACGAGSPSPVWSITFGAPCFGDLNDDGVVNTSDLLLFLTEFGCTSGCMYDLNGDGANNTSDLLIFLAAFGTVCP